MLWKLLSLVLCYSVITFINAFADSTVPVLAAGTSLTSASMYLANAGANDNKLGFNTTIFGISAGNLTINAGSIGNSFLTNSSITLNTHSLSLGGSLTLGFSDLSGAPSAAQLETNFLAAMANQLTPTNNNCVVGNGSAWTSTTCPGGGGSLTLTDGTHTVTGTTQISVTGGTVGGTTPNATLAITGGSGVSSLNGATGAISGALFGTQVTFGNTSPTIAATTGEEITSGVTSFTVPQTATLPCSTAVNFNGWLVTVADDAGLINGANSLTVAAASAGCSDTITGGSTSTTAVLGTAHDVISLQSRSGGWTIVNTPVPTFQAPAGQFLTALNLGGFSSAVPVTPFALGTSASLSAPTENYVCTGACTITPPTPVAGYKFVVTNDDNNTGVITLAALTGIQYEDQARTAYCSTNATLSSSGATTDRIELWGRDSTHYLVPSTTGTWTCGSSSSFALVASTTAGASGSATVTTTGIDTTGSKLIVVAVSEFAGGAPPGTLTDSKSNTWTALTANTDSTNQYSRLYYSITPTVGAGHTFTITATGTFPAITVFAFSDSLGTPAFDTGVQNGGNTGGAPAASIQTGSVTPSVNGSLLITGLSMGGGGTVASINSSFTTPLQTAPSSGVTEGVAASYLFQGTASAVNPTWSVSPNANLASTIASFKP